LRESESQRIFRSGFRWQCASMLRCISRFWPPFHRPATGNPMVEEVPLDGAETKSEDYQMDGRGRAAETARTVLN